VTEVKDDQNIKERRVAKSKEAMGKIKQKIIQVIKRI